MCGRLENALALEGESRVPNGYKEWPENIVQASVNTKTSEIVSHRTDLWKDKLLYTGKFGSLCFCCLHKEEIETSAEE